MKTLYEDNSIEFYNKLVNRYNRDYKSGDHYSHEIQIKKFYALFDSAQFDYSSVLEVGCGVGLFYDFLESSLESFRYMGIDISDRAVRVATETHDNVDFRNISIMDDSLDVDVEYVVADGLFNMNLEGYSVEYRNEVIEKMYDIAEKAVAINFNSNQDDNKNEKEVLYFSPGEVLDYALSIANKAVLRHDYLDNNFTLYMYK